MAIQIRRGSNAEWEVNNSNIVVGEPAVATDSKRAFIGTASGAYMELANIEALAPKYDSTKQYGVGDYVSYQGKLYVCVVPTSGAWDSSAWQQTSIGQALAENAYINFETQTNSGDLVTFSNGAGGIPVKDLQVRIEAVQSGSGDPSPENIRQISGWDEVNVNVARKNLIDSDFLLQASGWTKDSNGVYSGNSKALYDVFRAGVPSYTLKGKQSITISFYAWNDSALRSIYVYLIYTDGTRESVQVETTSRTLFQIHSNPTKDISILAFSYSNQVITHIDSFQIEQGQVVTAYEPYNGNTYTIDLDGTRYGGTLDVTTGVLTIDKGYVDLGTINWTKSTVGSNVTIFYSDAISDRLGGSKELICSNYRTINGDRGSLATNDSAIADYNNANQRVAIRDSTKDNDTDTSFKSAMSGVQLVYELATPQVVQLTPTQVRTVLGTNNIWADSGEVEVTYRISKAL